MRQRVLKLLAALFLIVAGVGVTAAVASAVAGNEAPVSSPDANQWD